MYFWPLSKFECQQKIYFEIKNKTYHGHKKIKKKRLEIWDQTNKVQP